jgi:hypothetical protein
MSFKSQLKKYFSLSIETLLLVGPLIIFVIFYFFYKGMHINPYFTISIPFIISNNTIVIHLGLFSVPYLMHRFLRDKQLGSEAVHYGHVLLSIGLLFAMLFTYQLNVPFSYTGREDSIAVFGVAPETSAGMEATSGTYLVLGLQLLIQLIFIIYALLLMFPAKQKEVITEYSQSN